MHIAAITWPVGFADFERPKTPKEPKNITDVVSLYIIKYNTQMTGI